LEYETHLTMTTLERIPRIAKETRAAQGARTAPTRIIAVANQKGGVGKTDLTVNMSCQLASAGRKVLLVDMDPQANATGYLMGPETSIGKTTADLLLDDSVSLEDVIVKDCRKNLDVAPADANLSACQIRLANDINMQFKLKKKLKSLSEVEPAYDFVVIDTPPSLGLLTVNTLTAANQVLIPVQSQYLAMEGVVQLMETVRKIKEDINPGLEVLGAVLTMYDTRTLLSREVELKVRSGFADGRVFSTVIPVNVRLAEAPSYHKSILEYDSECKGAKAYEQLAGEILSCLDA
jgi:chromosome partitioning protein